MSDIFDQQREPKSHLVLCCSSFCLQMVERNQQLRDVEVQLWGVLPVVSIKTQKTYSLPCLVTTLKILNLN